MLPPKHIVSAATIVLNEQKEVLLIKRSSQRMGNAWGTG